MTLSQNEMCFFLRCCMIPCYVRVEAGSVHVLEGRVLERTLNVQTNLEPYLGVAAHARQESMEQPEDHLQPVRLRQTFTSIFRAVSAHLQTLSSATGQPVGYPLRVVRCRQSSKSNLWNALLVSWRKGLGESSRRSSGCATPTLPLARPTWLQRYVSSI